MTGGPNLEARLRRHLSAEADELPFLLDAGAVEARMAARRPRWHPLLLVPAAAAAVLALVIGQALWTGPGPMGSSDSGDWGPLAAVPSTGGDQALTAGVLRITDQCVFLETAGGESELLVWPADRARWDDATGTIHFTNPPAGDGFTLRDGQSVSFGGGGDSTAESGLSGAEWAASVDWVAAPDPSCAMEVRWYVGEVSAQGPAADAHVIVDSGAFPGTQIACRGELSLEAEACRTWGDELLTDSTLAHDGVTLLVMTANAGDRRRCAADFYVAEDRPPPVTAAVVCPESVVPPSGATPEPQQNFLEATIVDALAVLGLEGQRVEYSPTSAFIRVPLEEDAALYVHAFPTDTDRGDLSVLDDRVIAGLTVERVEYASGPVRDRFDCADGRYEVEGATPPTFSSIDALLAELIPLLGCAPPSGTPSASGPTAELVGVIRGAPDLEGGICPVLLTDAEGEKWEVYLAEPYRREYRGDELVIIGPNAEVVARSGDRVGFNYRREPGMGSFCMVGMPVIGTEIVFVEPRDD